MNCCVNCFGSHYLHEIIIRNKAFGDCDYCGSVNANIYDPSELSVFFRPILDLYDVDNENGQPIPHQIVSDFNGKVFSSQVVQREKVKELFENIIQDEIEDYWDILTSNVVLSVKSNGTEDVLIKPLNTTWDKFSEEIKTVNRFHFVNALDLDRLKTLFRYFEKEIPKGRKFYRARITNGTSGFPLKEMKNPPNHLARGGRANPEGISYLYLSSDIRTTMYETRASLFDYVSVATFRLEENLRIVHLSQETYDVFRLAEIEQLGEVVLHGSFINKLEEELSRPKRKSDSDLDYLPTQYLSELIKSMDIDGIEFKSSLYEDGYNLAIFNPDKFKAIKVEVYDVSRIEIDFEKVIN